MPRKKATTKRAPAKRAPAKRSTVKGTTAKRTTGRTAAARKTPKTAARKATTKKAPVKATAIKEAFTKSQLFAEIAETTDVTKKQVSDVFEVFSNLIHRHIKSGGAGEFKLPGLLKIQSIRKPATKARQGINPFTGEMTTFKAKPARNVVKKKKKKSLKEMV